LEFRENSFQFLSQFYIFQTMSVNELTVANYGSCCLEVSIKISKLFWNELPHVNFSLRKSKLTQRTTYLQHAGLRHFIPLFQCKHLYVSGIYILGIMVSDFNSPFTESNATDERSYYFTINQWNESSNHVTFDPEWRWM